MISFLDTFPWRLFFLVLSFAWGACIGSFLNVCIYRIPRDLSVVKPRSFCPACATPIPWFCNIPIFSYLFLRGKCRNCNAPISIRYPLVEVITGVLFVLVWLKYAPSHSPRPLHLVGITAWPLVPVYWVAVAGLILGTFVDFEQLIIPDRVTWGGMIAGIIFSALFPDLHGQSSTVWSIAQSLLGGALGFCVLLAVGYVGTLAFKKEAMGFGDVKLMGAVGAFFGWKGVLFNIMVSSLIGSVVGIILVAMKKKDLQSKIPYGPYIALAAVIWILWGDALWNAYLNIFPQPE